MKNNKLTLNLKYICNFNPNFLIKPTHLNKKKNKIIFEKINCKNFIIFFILIKNVFKNTKISFFNKPKKSVFSNTNILRGPYKNKMARHQINISRYFFNIKIVLKLKKNLIFNQQKNIFIFINFFKNFYSFFESNLVFQHKSSFTFFFSLKNFFFI